MSKLIPILLSILFLATSCDKKAELSSKQIDRYFSADEREELAKIVSFVDSLVLSKTDFTDIDSAYHQYLSHLRHFGTSGIDWAFDEEMKHEFLFNIDSTLFNKIWIKYNPRRVQTRDTTLYNQKKWISIDLSCSGPFIDLIKDLSQDNEHYQVFHEGIEVSCSIGPYTVAKFLSNHQIFDFENSNNRLWVVVFLLNLKEPVEQKLDRYLNQSKP